MLRLDYGSPAARVFAARIARCIRDQAYLASAGLAAERGVFPAYAPRPYLGQGRMATCRPPCRPPSGGTASGTTIWFRSRPRAASALPSSTIARPASRPPHAWQYRRRLHRRGPGAQRGGAESRMAALAPVAWRWRRTAALLPPRGRYRPIRAYRHAGGAAALGGCRDFEDGAAAARVHGGGGGRRAVPASLAPGSERSDGVRPDPRMPAVLEPARHEGQNRPGGSAAPEGCRVTRWRAALRRQRAQASGHPSAAGLRPERRPPQQAPAG